MSLIVKYLTINDFNQFKKVLISYPQYNITELKYYITETINCNNISNAINIQSDFPNVSFNLKLNNINNEFNSEIKKLNINKLDLSYSSITDDLMVNFHEFKIKELDLSNTKITDLKFIKYLPYINKLNLSHCYITDESMINLHRSKIISLNLSNTLITKLNFIQYMPYLKELLLINSKVSVKENSKAKCKYILYGGKHNLYIGSV
jgi:hypothetical protein